MNGFSKQLKKISSLKHLYLPQHKVCPPRLLASHVYSLNRYTCMHSGSCSRKLHPSALSKSIIISLGAETGLVVHCHPSDSDIESIWLDYVPSTQQLREAYDSVQVSTISNAPILELPTLIQKKIEALKSYFRYRQWC